MKYYFSTKCSKINLVLEIGKRHGYNQPPVFFLVFGTIEYM